MPKAEKNLGREERRKLDRAEARVKSFKRGGGIVSKGFIFLKIIYYVCVTVSAGRGKRKKSKTRMKYEPDTPPGYKHKPSWRGHDLGLLNNGDL